VYGNGSECWNGGLGLMVGVLQHMIWSGRKCYLLVARRKCYLLFLKNLIINWYNLQLKKKEEKEKIRKERKRKILKTHQNSDNSDDDIIDTVKIILTR